MPPLHCSTVNSIPMPELHITEVLPEGDDAAWITLGDGLTRLVGLHPLMALPTHRALRLQRLVRRPRLTPDGMQVMWPGGATLDAASVHQAPGGPLPLALLAVVPTAQRYRPLAALLSHTDPPVPDYLDVRPEHTVRSGLGLSPGDLTSVVERHGPVPHDLMVARLSDLLLTLRQVLPGDALPALLRQPWPYARRHHPHSILLDTALGCLRFGRIDLVEAPLIHLLLPPWSGAATPLPSTSRVTVAP